MVAWERKHSYELTLLRLLWVSCSELVKRTLDFWSFFLWATLADQSHTGLQCFVEAGLLDVFEKFFNKFAYSLASNGRKRPRCLLSMCAHLRTCGSASWAKQSTLQVCSKFGNAYKWPSHVVRGLLTGFFVFIHVPLSIRPQHILSDASNVVGLVRSLQLIVVLQRFDYGFWVGDTWIGWQQSDPWNSWAKSLGVFGIV